MDIGRGIHLNAWRGRTCRMKEGGQTPRSGNGKKLPREQLHTMGTVRKGPSRPARRKGRTRPEPVADRSSMPGKNSVEIRASAGRAGGLRTTEAGAERGGTMIQRLRRMESGHCCRNVVAYVLMGGTADRIGGSPESYPMRLQPARFLTWVGRAMPSNWAHPHGPILMRKPMVRDVSAHTDAFRNSDRRE
jgi:hypothetical protein